MSVDLVISGATVFPGDGPSFEADVSVADGSIAAVGHFVVNHHKVDARAAGQEVDGAGLLLCPGFVDCTRTRRCRRSPTRYRRRRSRRASPPR
jgi:N-acyl-D-aspartate/D-glutamate deacylase